MTRWPRLFLLAAIVAAAGTQAALAQTPAQAFPSKAVRLVVPFPAGGSTDTVTRVVARRLSEDWGQPVVVDNRAGAGHPVAPLNRFLFS